MRKYILAVVILVIAVIIGFYLYDASSGAYVAAVDDEVTQLETELADLDAAVAAGELTPDAAEAARARIANRLAAINTAVDASGNAKLTDAQKQQLLGALDRLKGVLVTYRATLTTVETESKKSSRRRSGGGGNRSIVDIIDETIDNIEEHADEVIEDYEPEEGSMDEESEDGMDDTATTTDNGADDEVDEDMEDSTATSTDDGTATTTDSGGDDEEETTQQ